MKKRIRFQLGAEWVKSLWRAKKHSVPALRYDNPNPNGVHFVKFAYATASKEAITLFLKYTKGRTPVFSKAALENSSSTLRRVQDAMRQNPEFHVCYEFPDEKVAAVAREFLRQNKFENIRVVVRTQ
jgi:filamentous hemagglutinin